MSIQKNINSLAFKLHWWFNSMLSIPVPNPPLHSHPPFTAVKEDRSCVIKLQVVVGSVPVLILSVMPFLPEVPWLSNY